MIKEIAFVAYPANDVGALIPFYRDTLGLNLTSTYDEENKAQYAEFNVGQNGWFGLMNKDWVDRPAGSGVGVAFEVDDIEATVAELRGKGITVADVYPTPVCKVTSFEDPEGNKVTLHQSTLPH
ncbi:MAG TPA: VOC family protein [Candidatus Baltobacteraceae bacterium]|jgi:predicted enzyme related to lactoylglutathione lyase